MVKFKSIAGCCHRANSTEAYTPTVRFYYTFCWGCIFGIWRSSYQSRQVRSGVILETLRYILNVPRLQPQMFTRNIASKQRTAPLSVLVMVARDRTIFLLFNIFYLGASRDHGALNCLLTCVLEIFLLIHLLTYTKRLPYESHPWKITQISFHNNIILMKIFRTESKEMVKEWQWYFGLHSVAGLIKNGKYRSCINLPAAVITPVNCPLLLLEWN